MERHAKDADALAVEHDPGAGVSRTPWRWFAVAVALYLLFCHGCHGDEDNELFASRHVYVTDAALP